MASPIRFGEHDLLEYNPRYSLLICRECQYAIQKSALEGHLLRHKIYRGDRQRLLSSIGQLDLLEPDDVPLPAPGSPPVNALPVLSGFRCTAGGCQHLTVSSKRMKRHWSEVHGSGGSVPDFSSFACSVKLQTFFRGTKVRYFEVASSTEPLLSTDDNGDEDGGERGEDHDEDSNNAVATISAPQLPQNQPPPLPHPPEAAQGSSVTSIDLGTLTYFHHYITVTSLTLPGGNEPHITKHYWQTHIVAQALRRRWLMCGLLAISAHHSATLTDDAMTKWNHLEREAQFSSEFSAGLGSTTGRSQELEDFEIGECVNGTGEQIVCLLRCAQWELVSSTPVYDLAASCNLQTVLSSIRGCAIPDLTFHDSEMENDDPDGQEGIFAVRTDSSSIKLPSVLLTRLRALPLRIADALGAPESVEDVFATMSAITTMVECCGTSFACDELRAAWQGMVAWLAKVTNYFTQMVLRSHPAALTVLAHWAAILVKRAEQSGCWFLKGAARMIVLEVIRQLSAGSCPLLGLVESLTGIVNE